MIRNQFRRVGAVTLLFGALALAAVACGVEGAPPAAGEGDGGGVGRATEELTSTGQGFIWVNASGTTNRQRNITVTPYSSTKLSTGSYQITTGFSVKHVQLSVAGTSPGICKVFSTGPISFNVLCYNAAGALADTPFVAVVMSYASTNVTPRAFYANITSTGAQAGGKSWNSSGGTITSSLDAMTKVFTIDAAGMTNTNASVHVTTQATDTSRCRILGWSSGATFVRVRVECRTSAGVLSTPGFYVWYGDGGPFSELQNFSGPVAGGHAWHNAGSHEDPLYNRKLIRECPATGTLTAFASGNDRLYPAPVDLYQLSALNELAALVTPYGAGQVDCRARFVSPNFVVSCSTYAGVTVNANTQQYTFSMGTFDYATCF